MNSHAWVEEVLRDVMEYSEANELSEFAEDLRIIYAKHARNLLTKVERIAPPTKVRGPRLQL